MSVKTFKASITATKHDVVNANLLFIFDNGESEGALELEGEKVLKVGETGKAKITLNKGLEIAIKDKFISKILTNGENSGGQVIEF
jgi:hypothetical protein